MFPPLWMRSYSADFGFCRSVIKWIATFVLSRNFLAFWRVLQTFWLLAPKAQKLGLRTLRRARSEAYPAQTCPNSLIALKKQLSCRLTSLASLRPIFVNGVFTFSPRVGSLWTLFTYRRRRCRWWCVGVVWATTGEYRPPSPSPATAAESRGC